MIDPACGSGHFLLGAFHKLLAAWEAEKPGADKWELIREALSSVHGVDKNPFAAAIARFRLMLAAMRAGGVARISEQVDFPLNIAVGDSLLHGKGAPGRQVEFDFHGETNTHSYRTEDVEDFIKSCNILEVGTNHVVAGNPPYITVKDKAENETYRKSYESCSGKYALSVPFAERIFQLAIRDVGYTGQITANSFMKREFGKKLIEEFFAHRVDLTHVIDTSGAYIPGHGTPTVILLGRRRFPRTESTVRAVLGIRGEPTQPEDPGHGHVWQAIVGQVEKPRSESEWVSVDDLPRDHFADYPWSLSGGGAGDLLDVIEAAGSTLGDRGTGIGFTAITAEDDAFFVPDVATIKRVGVERSRPMGTGDVVRDFATRPDVETVWPYDAELRVVDLASNPGMAKFFWPNRRVMQRRKRFGTPVERIASLQWYEFGELYREKLRPALRIPFAFVATHNHFVLDRGGKVFKQSAPVIKLPEGATEADHLALLGVLNSSTGCFWLKQVSHGKGNGGVNEGYRGDEWEEFFEFTGTKLDQFPLPADLPLEFGRQLDSLAQQLSAFEPTAVCASSTPTRSRLDAARGEHARIRSRMIAIQEELDWDVYRRYGVISDEEAAGLIAKPGIVPEINLGERAFEIVLARRIERGESETQWLTRHRSTPITEIPAHWAEEYRQVVARRIEVIERDRNIGLIERPESKRRWLSEPWERKEVEALATWLLDRCEERSLCFGADGEPVPMTVNRLADRLRTDADVVSVARLLRGQDADLGDVLKEVIAEEHVPFLAQYRYKPSGLDKRRQWERTWDLQREEDATGKKLDIDVPPRYAGADFQKQSYWRHRGKLDVPKERFISYPDASPDSDPNSLLIGWAGWDHREQAAALITLIQERSDVDGWDTPKLMGLLAGLLEVMPWVRQWHGEVNPDFGMSYADAYDGYLTAQRESRSLTEGDLRTWTPTPPARGGRKRRE